MAKNLSSIHKGLTELITAAQAQASTVVDQLKKASDAASHGLEELNNRLTETIEEERLSPSDFLQKLKELAESNKSDANELYKKAEDYHALMPNAWKHTPEPKQIKKKLLELITNRKDWINKKTKETSLQRSLDACQAEIKKIQDNIYHLNSEASKLTNDAFKPPILTTLSSMLSPRSIDEKITIFTDTVAKIDAGLDDILKNSTEQLEHFNSKTIEANNIIQHMKENGITLMPSVMEPEITLEKFKKNILKNKIMLRLNAFEKSITEGSLLLENNKSDTSTNLEKIQTYLNSLLTTVNTLQNTLCPIIEEIATKQKSCQEQYHVFCLAIKNRQETLATQDEFNNLKSDWERHHNTLTQHKENSFKITNQFLVAYHQIKKEDFIKQLVELRAIEEQEASTIQTLMTLKTQLKSKKYALYHSELPASISTEFSPSLSEYQDPKTHKKIKQSEVASQYIQIATTLQKTEELYGLKPPEMTEHLRTAGHRLLTEVSNRVDPERLTAAGVVAVTAMTAPLPSIFKFLAPVLSYMWPRMLAMPIIGATLASHYNSANHDNEQPSRGRQVGTVVAGAAAGAVVDHYSQHKILVFLSRMFAFIIKRFAYFCITGYHILQRWDKNEGLLRSRIEGGGLLIGGFSFLALLQRIMFTGKMTKLIVFAGGASLGANLSEKLAEWFIGNKDQYWIEGKKARKALNLLGISYQQLEKEYEATLQALEQQKKTEDSDDARYIVNTKDKTTTSLGKIRLLQDSEELTQLLSKLIEARKPIAEMYHANSTTQITLFLGKESIEKRQLAFKHLVQLEENMSKNNAIIEKAKEILQSKQQPKIE